MSRGFEQISIYVERLGLETALRLVAGWGGKTLYVPGRRENVCDHLISFVLGADGAESLQKWYGCQTIEVPELHLRPYSVRANVIRMVRLGISIRDVASLLSISRERVKQIVREFPMLGSDDPRAKARQIADHSRTQSPAGCPLFESQNETVLGVGQSSGDPVFNSPCGAADPRNLSSAESSRASFRGK
jgi:hypothetical protein